jgi:hypothetical protein
VSGVPIDAQYVARNVRAVFANLVANYAVGIHPRSFFCEMKELPNDAVKFCVGLHQTAAARDSAIVVVQGAKWYLTLSDWHIWLHPKGRQDVTQQLREYVNQMYNHTQTAPAVVLS